MQRKLLIIFAILMMSVVLANAAPRPPSGVLEGVIIDVGTDIDGTFAIWLKIDEKMHRFTVREARIINGDLAALVAGVPVRIQYRNLGPSKMDDFFAASAVTVTVLKEGKK